ncbi:hypothetical protein [Fodinicola feengrottensis]|uniref:Uncharacterized protein n=1 Tax=Fodinicola feengrottensis TaxID=435914 RepID=A0ABN2INI0_9ACTN|nr:hypothetical protein [Fodinicola feengrottensis]
MPYKERRLPSIRIQTASDLWTWAGEISVTTQLLRRAESTWGASLPNARSARVLLFKASDLLRERAHIEAGEWNRRWRPLRHIVLGVLGGPIVVLAGSSLPLPIYLGVPIVLVPALLASVTIGWLAMTCRFRRLDHTATPCEAADAILAQTSPIGDESGRSERSRLDTRMNVLMAGRRAGAMRTKVRLLEEPERIAAARFPSALLKDCTDAKSHLYAAMVLLEELENSLRKFPKRP